MPKSPLSSQSSFALIWSLLRRGWGNLNFQLKLIILLVVGATLPVIAVTQGIVTLSQTNLLAEMQRDLRKDLQALADEVTRHETLAEVEAASLARQIQITAVDLSNPQAVLLHRPLLNTVVNSPVTSFSILTDSRGASVAQKVQITAGNLAQYPALPLAADAKTQQWFPKPFLTPHALDYYLVPSPVGIHFSEVPIVKAVLTSRRPLAGVELLNSQVLERLGLAAQAQIGLRPQQTKNLPQPRQPSPEGTYNTDHGRVGLVIMAVQPIRVNQQVVGTAIVGTLLNRNYEIVDRIQRSYDVPAVSLMAQDWRVSTNVPYVDPKTKTTDNTRAIGTRVSREVAAVVLDQGREFVGQANIVGVDYLTAYAPLYSHQQQLNPAQAKPVGMLFVGEPEQALQDLLSQQQLLGYSIGGGILLLVGMLSISIAGSFSRSLRSLARFAQRIATVEKGARLETTERQDEIGILFRELNQMAADIEANFEAVQQQVEERKQAEAALRHSQQKLSLHLQQTPLAAIEWSLDFEITGWNLGAEAIFGYCKDEAVGRHAIGLIVPDSARERVNQVRNELIAKKGGIRSTNKNLTKDGKTILCEWYNTPLVDENGNVIAIASLGQDITDRHRAETALQQAEAKYRSIFENTIEGIFQTLPDGRYISANPALARIYGYESREALIKNLTNLEHQLYVDSNRRAEFTYLIQQQGLVSEFESQIYHQDGSVRWISENARAVCDPDGKLLYYEGTVEDITERKHFEAQLAYLANRDSLTGLFNRRYFQAELERQLSTAQHGMYGAILFLDLDDFKGINDGLGHQAGDDLLKQLAVLLREQLRQTDILARIGGDEFAALLPYTEAEQAQQVAERLLNTLKHHFVIINNQPVHISISLGIALFPEHGSVVDKLLAYADTAMYQAKEKGRNQLCLYPSDQSWQQQAEAERGWKRQIRKALEEDRFVLYWQPILSLCHNQVSRYELLLRLRGNPDQLILPTAFLPTAERHGLICDIDRWVVREAIHLIAEHNRVGHNLTLEVNLSGKSLADCELLSMIQRELTVTGVSPAQLILEITETTAIADMTQARKFMDALKRLGCQFALDDFGTGYSSFSQLKLLPVDYLKIDGSFIQNLSRDLVDQHLVKAIVEVACGLKKQTIAEFVEDEVTVELLCELGVDYAQGYYIGQPSPVPNRVIQPT